MGLLGRSSHIPMADLGIPDAWDRLYRMTGQHGDLFARRNGALTAVFPRSDYVRGRDGVVSVVPPNTVYVIGEPPAWLLRQFGLDDGYEELTLPTRLDYSLPAWAPEPPQPADSRTTQASGKDLRRASSMWFNDRVRQHRITARLAQAAARARE